MCADAASGARVAAASYAGLAIEGELAVTLLSTEGPPVGRWREPFVRAGSARPASYVRAERLGVEKNGDSGKPALSSESEPRVVVCRFRSNWFLGSRVCVCV